MMNSYSLVERINSKVNASVTYKTDLAQYGTPEHWCLPTALATVKTMHYSSVSCC